MLRQALHPAGRSGPSAPIAVAEMPRPQSIVPQIVYAPAVRFMQASRTVLSAFRKTPPPRPDAPAVPAPGAARQTRRVAAETRFEHQDFPIL